MTWGRSSCVGPTRSVGMKQCRDMRGEPVPKAIDDFIDEMLGLVGVSFHLELQFRNGSANEGVFWSALLLQAKAKCVQAEANFQQEEANEETSHTPLVSTQGIVGKGGTIDMKLDRLESWYAARDDAANRVSILAR